MGLKSWPAGKRQPSNATDTNFPAGHVTQNATTYEVVSPEKVREGEQTAGSPQPMSEGPAEDQ